MRRCGLRGVGASRWLLEARPVRVLSSPEEPAHDLGRFGCVCADLLVVVCSLSCVSVTMWNESVRLRVCVVCVLGLVQNRAGHKMFVLGSTIELDNDLRRFGCPKHMF